MSERRFRFLGMTKVQALGVGMTLFAVMTLASVLLLASAVRDNAAQTQVAYEAHVALCALRKNTQRQIETTANFLATHPGAEPIPGIPRQVLFEGLKRQRAFRDALRIIDCSP